MKNKPTLRERIASRIIVDCGYDSEYPCPYAHPTMGYEKCPHNDEEICMWQREQAKGFINLLKEELEGLTVIDIEEFLLEHRNLRRMRELGYIRNEDIEMMLSHTIKELKERLDKEK